MMDLFWEINVKLVAIDVKLLVSDMSESEQMNQPYIGNISVYKLTCMVNAREDTSLVQRCTKNEQHDDINLTWIRHVHKIDKQLDCLEMTNLNRLHCEVINLVEIYFQYKICQKIKQVLW